MAATAASVSLAQNTHEHQAGLGDVIDRPLARLAARCVAVDREAVPGLPLTPRCLALGAARLLLLQELRRQKSGLAPLGALSVLDSLRVAAGGHYTPEGVPAPPDEPAIAAVLAQTVELLERALPEPRCGGRGAAGQGLGELRPSSLHESVLVQELLATVPERFAPPA